jgi:hypothetical protein
MVVMNTAKETKKVEIGRYSERTNGFSHFTNILTQQKELLKDFSIEPYQTVVYELRRK